MIAFAVEPWLTVQNEVAPLWLAHYNEIGEDKDAIPLDPDTDGYTALADAGRLHIVTARRAGELVGYVFALVGTHLHYKTTLFANLDLYYLLPDCRGGRTAVRMFDLLESSLKAIGVVKVIGNTKLAKDQSRLFGMLGWREAERIFVKVI